MKNLYINNNFVIVKNDYCCQIINRINSEKYELTDDGYEIVKYISENNNVNKYITDEEIEFINSLIKVEILTEDKLDAGFNNIKNILNKPALKRIFLEVTGKCNLKCKHCYNSSSINKSCEGILTFNEIKKLIDDAHKMGVWQFDFTGGEAFLRDDIFEILEYATSKGMQIAIFTNLTLLNKEKVEKLKKLKIKKIITSIDAFSNKIHDDFRGVKGSLEKTIENIKLLKDNNINVVVNTMIGEHNELEINEMIDYFNLQLNVKYIPDVILPTGRGATIKYNNKYSKLIPYLINLQNQNINCDIENCDTNCQINTTFCGVGDDFLYITYDGNINLCPSLTGKENENFCFGNIKFDSLELTWNNNSKLKKYRNLNCKYKNECSKKNECSGGCRSRAYAFTNLINSPDPAYCDMYNVEFKE